MLSKLKLFILGLGVGIFFGSALLASSATCTGVFFGGTGVCYSNNGASTWSGGAIPIGNYSSALATSSNLTFATTTNTLSTNTLSLTNALTIANGGTGQTTFTSSQLLYGNGTAALTSVATSSGSCSAFVTCNGFTVVGNGSPSIILNGTLSPDQVLYTNHAGTGVLTIATTTVSAGIGLTGSLTTLHSGDSIALSVPVLVTNGGTGDQTFTASQLIYGNGTNALSSVATSSETCSSPLSCTAFNIVGSGGAISITTPITQANGGTGASSIGANMIITNNGSNVLVSSSTPTAAAYLATSTTATSTFNGAFQVGSTPSFQVTSGGETGTCESKPATSTTMVIDWQNTCPQVLLQMGTSAFSVTLINATTSNMLGSRKMIVVCNPNASAGAITWAGAEWYGGTVPTQTTAANQCDAWSFHVTQATSTSAYKVFGAQNAGAQ